MANYGGGVIKNEKTVSVGKSKSNETRELTGGDQVDKVMAFGYEGSKPSTTSQLPTVDRGLIHCYLIHKGGSKQRRTTRDIRRRISETLEVARSIEGIDDSFKNNGGSGID